MGRQWNSIVLAFAKLAAAIEEILIQTINLTPDEMARYIARFDDLVANKARTSDKIPLAARETLIARSTLPSSEQMHLCRRYRYVGIKLP